MASRWKRFAFFDRKNLPLPPSVVSNLLPVELSRFKSGTTSSNNSSSSSDGNEVCEALYPHEEEAEAHRLGIGDYFSLCCGEAELPKEVREGVERNVAGEGLGGLLSAWMARRGEGGVEVAVDSASSDGGGSDDNATLQLVLVSSRNTHLIHCIDVTGRCTPTNPQLNQKRSNDRRDAFQTNNDVDEEGTVEELDGWRGYFDPFSEGKKSTTNANTTAAAVGGGVSGRSVSSRGGKRGTLAEQRILEEHLSPSDNNNITSSSTESSSLFASSPFAKEDRHARIIDVACCTTASHTLYVASITDANHTTGVIVHTDPHLRLQTTMPPPPTFTSSDNNNASWKYSKCYKPSSLWNSQHGNPRCVTIQPGVCCVGTDSGVVLIYVFHPNGDSNNGKMSMVAEIPAPRGGADVVSTAAATTTTTATTSSLYCVSSLELIPPPPTNTSSSQLPYSLFVSYRKRHTHNTTNPTETSGGVCCYTLGGLRIPINHETTKNHPTNPNAPVVSARYDLDNRDVSNSSLCHGLAIPPYSMLEGNEVMSSSKLTPRYAVARSDGLHFYSSSEKAGVCPVEGDKIGIAALPPAPIAYLKRRRPRPVDDEEVEGSQQHNNNIGHAGASYVLVVTRDSKANRDAVDIYDTSNKLVGFHALLSPGHRALRMVGVVSPPEVGGGVLMRGGRTSGVVFTSGGSIVTLTGEFSFRGMI